MDWQSKLSQALEYIEHNLDGEIDYDKVAQLVCCSTFQFQRIFSFICGIPLGEYIRRRKMTLAALELQTSDIKVIDAALKYGYDSPTAFNRAFQSIHGVSPAAARKAGVKLRAYPRISFTLSIKGDTEMIYKIESKRAFRVVGAKRSYPLNDAENLQKIPIFWREAVQTGLIDRICALIDQEPNALLGICSGMDGKNFDYYIAAPSIQPVPEGMTELDIPETIWAVFECVGPMPGAIQDIQKRVFSEWLPASGYDYANLPDLEVYYEGDQSAHDYKTEYWLPVLKK